MITSIILAAGKGERFGDSKQFMDFKGKPLWLWAYDACKELDETIVVGIYCKGGKTRQESVLSGLRQAKGDYVIIFDSARPMVTKEQVEQITEAVKKYPSCSFGVEPTNTIYDDGEYKREGLIELQVPQAFDRKMLLEAHEATKLTNCTDDTRIFYDYHGITPKILEGGNNLYKLTYKEDLKILESL